MRPPTPSLSEKMDSVIRPKGPLKPRIGEAIRLLRPQIKKLDSMIGSLQKRDAKLFQQVVAAVQNHDTHGSKVLGSELAEIRKVIKILGGARTSLDRIELRLNTCSDLGDTVTTIMPTVALMRNVKSSLGQVMPGAEQELAQMSDMLGGFVMESLAGDSMFGMDTTTNAEADEILKEAAVMAGNSAEQIFPSVPAPTESTSAASGQQFGPRS